MNRDPQSQFPSPESQPPGRAAFEGVCRVLGDEAVAYQKTSRRIEAIYAAGRFFVDVTCGDSDTPISQFNAGHDQYLTAKVGRYSRAVDLGELTAPGGIEAFLSAEPPTTRIFRPGENPEGDLSDEAFDLAMQHLQEELPAATVAWIHEAIHITKLPPEHSSTRARVDKIIELAKDVPRVPLELDAVVDMGPIRTVSGWTLKALWRSANQTAVERGGTQELTQTRISLDYTLGDGPRYSYVRDVYGNEIVVAEVADPAKRDVLSAIGYNAHSRGGWGMWSREVAKLGMCSPPDSAFQDFARSIRNALAEARLDTNDIYMPQEDGTIKIWRPDGTVY